MDYAHELIGEKRIAQRDLMACGWLFQEPLLKLTASVLERLLQRFQDRRAGLVAMLFGKARDRAHQLAAIDDRALAGDAATGQAPVGHGVPFPCFMGGGHRTGCPLT